MVRVCPLLQDLKYRVGGVAVLDVVEGTFPLFPPSPLPSPTSLLPLSTPTNTIYRLSTRSSPFNAHDPLLPSNRLRQPRRSHRMARHSQPDPKPYIRESFRSVTYNTRAFRSQRFTGSSVYLADTFGDNGSVLGKYVLYPYTLQLFPLR